MTKVLIAEDSAVNRELLREFLEIRGYTVQETRDGQEALNRIEKERPDILLLDLNMPVLDGYATIQKIRENPALVTLPVLAVTAFAMRGDREKVMQSGFNGYLSKPVNPADLYREMERLLANAAVNSARTTVAGGQG